MATVEEQATTLAHLYAAMACLMALGAAGGGAAARVSRSGQTELWAAIARLGGNQQEFSVWRLDREREADAARAED